MNSKYKIFKQLIVVVIMVLLAIVSFSLTAPGKAYAKTSYPVIVGDGSEAYMNKTYSFCADNYDKDGTHYACIIRKNKVIAKLKISRDSEVKCIGKYNGKYYFNVRSIPTCEAVYTYKLGAKKFKRVCKGINLSYFKSSYTTYGKSYAGIINKRYVLARDYYPTDAYGGYGNIYVYDLKKNKKKLLGDARDATFVGKKIYWTTTVPFDWARADDPSIVVNEATMEGKKIRTILTIPFKDLNAGYGSGTIDKHYITWKFITNDGTGHATVKEKYR